MLIMVDQGNANIDNNQKPVVGAPTDVCNADKAQSKNTLNSLYIERFLRALNACTGFTKNS
jgi:hypothetical protein